MEIIRTELLESDGIIATRVYGINLFRANGISSYDAVYQFAKLLSLEGRCCLLLGGLCLNDLGDAELQQRFSLYAKVSTSGTGVHGGTFYNLRDMDQNFETPSLLIAGPSPELFDAEEVALEYGIRCDDLAIISLLPTTDYHEMTEVVNAPVKSHMDHVSRICKYTEILAYTQSDGFSFALWSKAEYGLERIGQLLDKITRIIAARPEFRSFDHDSYFDDVNDWCLKIRKGSRNIR